VLQWFGKLVAGGAQGDLLSGNPSRVRIIDEKHSALDFSTATFHIRYMRLPKIQIDEDIVISLAKKYGIRKISLFGSALRADFNRESDLDFLVEFEKERSYSLFDLFSIREDFSRALGRKVDLVEKAGLRNPYRKKAIIDSARLIYAA
jgi:predicted nucleotidyltransferase